MTLSVFQLTVKWLEGGRDDSFFILAQMPLDLRAVAAAMREYGDDECIFKMADELEDAIGNAHVNDGTRFVGVNGIIDNMPVVVEIQSEPFVAIGIKIETDLGDHVVKL